MSKDSPKKKTYSSVWQEPTPESVPYHIVEAYIGYTVGAALGIAMRDNPKYVMPSEKASKLVDETLEDIKILCRTTKKSLS